jgi:hypothetical protein
MKNVYKGKARKARKELLDEIRSVPCMDCGGSFPSCAMDFDHVRGEKKFGVMNRYGDYKLETLMAEIAKCEIICSNCHRIRTAARRG